MRSAAAAPPAHLSPHFLTLRQPLAGLAELCVQGEGAQGASLGFCTSPLQTYNTVAMRPCSILQAPSPSPSPGHDPQGCCTDVAAGVAAQARLGVGCAGSGWQAGGLVLPHRLFTSSRHGAALVAVLLQRHHG